MPWFGSSDGFFLGLLSFLAFKTLGFRVPIRGLGFTWLLGFLHGLWALEFKVTVPISQL